jgi:hypothetical protein
LKINFNRRKAQQEKAMGFSLAHFFEELEEIMNNGDIDWEERDLQLNHLIKERKRYAKECGQI